MKDDLEDLKEARQEKAMIAFKSLQSKAAKKGYISDEEIENEIKKARNEEQ